MRQQAIRGFYRLCKLAGLFHLARFLTRSELRILCYHGFVLADEEAFRKALFYTKEKFEERMRFLREKNFPILHLNEAVDRLREGTLPPNAVAVTIDDGFHSVFRIALDVLRKYEIPSTMYLTSYYFLKGTPIFELAVSYICWKSPRTTVDLSSLGVPQLSDARNCAFQPEKREAIAEQIVVYGKTELDEPGRVDLTRRLAERLDVDYAQLADSRILSLVSPEELVAMQDAGMRIGLHTHRHRFPLDLAQARAEIDDNRAAVEPVIGSAMIDFCYPSGDWSFDHWPVLAESRVQLATTCDSGLVYRDTAPLALPRILDDNRVSKIEFEAELYGFSELIRRIRRRRAPSMKASVATT